MTKYKRFILIGCALLAIIALGGLTVAAFAQGQSAPYLAGLSQEPGSAIAVSDQLAYAAPDQLLQGPAGDRRPAPFARDRMRENLALALGITPEELDAARWTAFIATLEDTVEEGYLAQKAADRKLAQAVIRRMADRDDLVAAGLGITVTELQASRDEGKTLRQLAAELGLDAQAIGQNLVAALEELILLAAEDGLITEQQADRILEDQFLERLAQGLWRPWLRQQRSNHPWQRAPF